MGIKLGIDGISASSIFLMTDGIIGGVVGLIITLLGGGYANFSAGHVVLGLVSGTLAGTGVLSMNIAIMEGLAGPAFAIGNLSSVIQALLDWGFLGQAPTLLPSLGLIIGVLGAIVMSIGDDFVIKPLFYPEEDGKFPLKLSKLIINCVEPAQSTDKPDLEGGKSTNFSNPDFRHSNTSFTVLKNFSRI